jgi:hypothetical protein
MHELGIANSVHEELPSAGDWRFAKALSGDIVSRLAVRTCCRGWRQTSL